MPSLDRFGRAGSTSRPELLARILRCVRRAAVIAALVAGVVLASSTGVLAPLSHWLGDLRFSAATRPASGKIVLVEIDARSLDAIGRWPWPRRIHGDLVRVLQGLGAADIAFDVDFSAASSEGEDAAFEEALSQAGGDTILAAFRQAPHEGADLADPAEIVNVPLARFRAHAWPALVNVRPDRDGLVRSVPFGAMLGQEPVSSLAALLAGAEWADRSFRVDWSIDPASFDRISAIDLIEGRIDRARIAGKSAIVGATAVELRDFFQVPAHGIVSGAILQAMAAETLRQGRALAATGLPVTAFGAELLALVLLAIHCRLRLRAALIGLAVLSAAIEALALVVQVRAAIVVDTAAWQLLLAGGAVAAVASDLDLKRFWLAVMRAQGRNTQTLLDQVVLDSFDGVVVVDNRECVQAASRAAATILTPSNGDWQGRPMRDVLPSALQAAVAETLRSGQIAAAGAGIREAVLRIGAVERVIEYTLTPSTLTGGIGQDPGAARTVVCLTFRDITDRRQAEKRLAYLARFDPLTGLMNRAGFSDRLAEIAESRSACAVLYFDLDRFKLVNDTMGHAIGDQVLQEVAARCQALLPHPVLVARFGGDEFAAMWPEAVPGDRLSDLAERLVRRLSEPYHLSGYRLSVGVSIGIADLDTAGRDTARLMINADAALYRAKCGGGGCHCFFDESMATQLHARQRLEVDLKDAIAGEQFEAAYQPQIDLRTGRISGVEALLRWKHPERGYVSPAEFIPVAEEIGAIDVLGEWILRRACRDVAGWPGQIRLAVNVSPLQFLRGELVAVVRNALADTGLAPERLDLEITESLFIHDDQHVQDSMTALRQDGVGFALDDFGTGYSSLSYVRRFPFDKIKVDRSFVSGLPHDADAVAIIQAIVAMASNLGIRINAEGIETPEQASFLRLLGCDEGQGFGLGRPQAAAAIAALLREEAIAGPRHDPAGADVTDVTA